MKFADFALRARQVEHPVDESRPGFRFGWNIIGPLERDRREILLRIVTRDRGGDRHSLRSERLVRRERSSAHCMDIGREKR